MRKISDFADDYYRMTGRNWSSEKPVCRILKLGSSHALRYLYAYRMIMNGRDPFGIFRLTEKILRRKTGLELDSRSIGRGLYLGHPYNISVSRYAVIGENCNLNKGAVLKADKQYQKPEAPVLGNQVWVGVNAVLVGKITVGDNVLIAPNAYVDRDVPPDSIVIGNPAVIHCNRPDAVDGYINYTV